MYSENLNFKLVIHKSKSVCTAGVRDFHQIVKMKCIKDMHKFYDIKIDMYYSYDIEQY